MVKNKLFRELALSFPNTIEKPHFKLASFRVGKKIFATLDESTGIGCVKLSLIDQNVFSSFDKDNIYAVPNNWGREGWTYINLKFAHKNLLKDFIKTAYYHTAPKKLSRQIKSNKNS
jgi:predicted DNA-binding protein (MmcQ/YjbR family)